MSNTIVDMLYSLYEKLNWPCVLRLGLAANCLIHPAERTHQKKLIIDTDLFSDVDDAGALLLASTLPHVKLLAVNINYPSSYSALAASAILAHYGHVDVPIGLRRPITNASFFDSWFYQLGEFASKVAFHWSGGTLRWGDAGTAWMPVELYRKVLSEQEDGSVTIASIGFLENLSGLLNSTADIYSAMAGPELVAAKVSELVVMGGGYPSGHEYNFWGDNPATAAHVVKNWKGRITYSGFELGGSVCSGASLTVEGPDDDPVRAAYRWYSGYNASRESWDPLTVLYACQGLGDLFEYANSYGYNQVLPNGSNYWVHDRAKTDQHWLRLRTDNATAGRELDRLLLRGARSVSPLMEFLER